MCYLQDVFGDKALSHGLPWEICHAKALRKKHSFFLWCLLGREINAMKAVIICCFIGLNYHPVSTETETLSHEQTHLYT